MNQAQPFSMPYSGGTVTAESEEACHQVIAELEQSASKQAERERVFPGTSREKMTALCKLFPSLRDEARGIEPWDVDRFILWALTTGGGSGLMHAIRFVLQVWNSSTDWPDLMRTISKRTEAEGETSGGRLLLAGIAKLRTEIKADLMEREENGRQRGRAVQAVAVDAVEIRLSEYFGNLGPFNTAAAFGTWDDEHREAFVTWCRFPFFP